MSGSRRRARCGRRRLSDLGAPDQRRRSSPARALPIVIGIVGNPDYQAEELQDVGSGVPARARLDAVGRRDGVPRPLQRAADAASRSRRSSRRRRARRTCSSPRASRIACRRTRPASRSPRGSRRCRPGGWTRPIRASTSRRIPTRRARTRPRPRSTAMPRRISGSCDPASGWAARTEVNATLFHVGTLRRPRRAGLHARRRARRGPADQRICRRSPPAGTCSIPRTPSSRAFAVVATQVPRSADIQLVWRF